MSDFGSARVEVRLDSRQAEQQLRAFLTQAASSSPTIKPSVDARDVAPAIEGAIDAADTGVEVTGDAREVTSTVEGALDAADTGVEVTGDAREVTSSVEGALDAADTGVAVTGDARQVTGAVEGALDAADTGVTVTGDARDVVSAVEGAIDAADTGVTVTGSATDVTGAINGAVAAADTSVTIDADASSLRGASTAADELTASLSAAQVVTTGLVAGIALIGGRALVRGIYDAAQAASALTEAQTKVDAVFRDSAGVVEQFGATATTSVALSESAALAATGTFGNLFTALGLTRQEAARMSPEVVRLATDFASFNNLNVDDTLVAIQAGLVGEIEPLRRLGVSFNAAQVEAKALELGLADTREELDEGAKVQARWALILEQSKNIQGDFTRTSEGLANQQRILTAEFQNALAEIGGAFVPVMLELVAAARDSLPALADLAEAGVGVLAAGLGALTPLLGSTTDILVALTPLVELLGTAIGAVPDEVIQAVGGFLALNRILRLVGAQSVSFGGGIGGIVTSLTRLNPAIAAAGAAFLLFTQRQEDARRAAETADEQIKSFTATMSESEGNINPYAAALQQAAEANEELEFRAALTGSTIEVNVNRLLRDAGVTVSQFATQIGRSDEGFRRWIETVARSRGLSDEQVKSLIDLRDQMRQAAQATIEGGVATEQWSQRQVDAAIRANTARDGTINYAAALQELQVQSGEAARAAEEQAAAQRQVNAELTAAVQRAPGLAEALRQVQIPGGAVRAEFTNLAVVLGRANLTQEQMGAVASRLGVSLDELTPHISEVIGVLDGLTSTAQGGIPGLDDLAGQVEDLENVSLPSLRETLSSMVEDYTAFNDNLRLIAQEAPILTQLAAQNPQIAATIAEGIRGGKDGAIDELELLAEALGIEQAELPGIIDDNAAALAEAARRSGQLADTKFIDALKPDRTTRSKFDAARERIRTAKEGLGVQAADTGAGAHAGFDRGIAPVPGTAATRMAQARERIRTAKEGLAAQSTDTGAGAHRGWAAGIAPTPGTAATRFAQARERIRSAADGIFSQALGTGGAAHRGFRDGTAPVPGTASARMNDARARIRGQKDAFSGAGRFVGDAASTGLRVGLDQPPKLFDTVITRVKDRVIGSFTRAFQIFSPARVMIPIGGRIVEGLAEGMLTNEQFIRNAVTQFGADIGEVFSGLVGGGGTSRGLVGYARAYFGLWRSLFPAMEIGGWRARGSVPGSDHPKGKALDLMTTNAATAGLIISLFKSQQGAKYWIWNRQSADARNNWRTKPYRGPSPHTDHVHLSYYQRGAWEVLRDELAMLHRGEMVVPAAPAETLRRVVETPVVSPAGGTIFNVSIQVPPETTDPFGFGRKAARGFESALAGRRVVFDARMS